MARVSPKVHLALLTVQLLFASWPIAGKLALQVLPAAGLVGIRATGAALVFFLLGSSRKCSLTLKQHGSLAYAGLLGVSVNQLLFGEGLARTSAVNATVLASTIPVFTLLLALAMRVETVSPTKVLGVAVAMGGVLVATGANGLDLHSRHMLGNVMMLANSLAYALYLIEVRKLSTSIPVMVMVPWVFFYGALFTWPAAIPSLLTTSPGDVTWVLVANLVYIVVGPTVGTYFLNAVAVRDASPSLAAVYVYLQPVVAALLAYPILGEQPTLQLALGAVGIFAGVTIFTRSAGQDSSPAAESTSRKAA